MLTKKQKKQMFNDLVNAIKNCPMVVVLYVRGLTAGEQEELYKFCKEHDVLVQQTKKTILSRALKETQITIYNDFDGGVIFIAGKEKGVLVSTALFNTNDDVEVGFAISDGDVLPGDSLQLPDVETQEEEDEEEVVEMVSIVLVDAGENKIGTIKALRDILGVGLMEAKKTADSAPVTIMEDVTQERASDIKQQLEGIHAVIRIEE